MCDCYDMINEKLTEVVQEKIKKEVGFLHVENSGFKHEPFYLEENKGDKAPFFLPFVVEYERKSKKSGKVRSYKKTVNFFPSHCPVCGEKYAVNK